MRDREDREYSDLSMSRAECPKCGAVWINGQHYWSGTGKKGNELDLAGLVCNKLANHQCINPKRGADGGDTWAKRLEDLQNNGPEMDKDMKDK
jgi:sRNA-binding protein